MKPGLSIQLLVAILGLVTVGAASACTCRLIGFESLVLDKRLSLAKIVVVPPTLTQRIASLLDLFKEETTYEVKVVEVITGRYDSTAIKVRSSGSNDCGVDLRHGETYYHLASPKAAGGDTYASVCNLVNEEYVRQVKAYKRRPKPELSPVPPGSWTEIFRSAQQTVHADYQVPSGMATMVGNKVFLSITMLVVDLFAASAGMDLPGKGMILRGDVA